MENLSEIEILFLNFSRDKNIKVFGRSEAISNVIE